jgi:hypothetical protein
VANSGPRDRSPSPSCYPRLSAWFSCLFSPFPLFEGRTPRVPNQYATILAEIGKIVVNRSHLDGPPDLLPDGVRELPEQDGWGVQIESTARSSRDSSLRGSSTNHVTATLASTLSASPIPVFTQQGDAVRLWWAGRRSRDLTRAPAEASDAGAPVHLLREHVADLALQRALVGLGLGLGGARSPDRPGYGSSDHP